VIRQELHATAPWPSPAEETDLYDDLERVFKAQQLYSYPGRYLRQQPSTDRIAETLYRLEEYVLEQERYPAPRDAEITLGEPIDVHEFLRERNLNAKTSVRAMTELLRERMQALLPSTTAGTRGHAENVPAEL